MIVGAHALDLHGLPRDTKDIKNKLASGRPQDIADASRLKEIQDLK